MWEGVINLPDPADATPQQQIEIVKNWCAAYEKMTGHKVLRADVHLDEGYIDAAGQPQFNAHAHVMCDRTDDKGKVKKLTSTVLREVQNMTAEVTTLARGLDARTTGRKHIGHHHFRYDAEKNRLDLEKEKNNFDRFQKLSKGWADEDFEKIKKLQAHIDDEPARLAAALAAQKAHLDEQYRQDRAALKASGEATQQDYQALKTAHEAELAKVKTKLAEAQQKATTTCQELAEATAKVATQAAVLTGLKADLAEALTQAAMVPELVATITSQTAAFENLKVDAMAVITPLRKEVKTMKTQIQEQNERFEAVAAITLKTLQQGFGVDIAPAAQLKGEDLEKWLQAAEDRVFEQQLAEMKTTTPAAVQAEQVWPHLSKQEFMDLDKGKLGERTLQGCFDVLVNFLSVAAAATKNKLLQPQIIRGLEKLLGNYITPPTPEPTKPVPTQTPERSIQPPRRSSIER